MPDFRNRMKLFPAKKYTVELMNDSIFAMEELKQNTMLSDSLVSDWTGKAFIGQVNKNRFKVISSEIGRGAVCVLIGEFQGNKGIIEAKIHDAFKVMFSILMSFPIIGLGIKVFNNGFEIGMLLPLIMGIVFIRFIFIEFSFRFISKTGLDKLTKVIRIVELKETENTS